MKVFSYISGVIVLAALAYLFLINLRNNTDHEVTSYPVLCNQPSTSLGTCEDAFAINRTTFRLDKKNNQVISFRPDISGAPMEKYTNCAIIDLKNWTCHYDDQSVTFGFKDGDYFLYSKSNVVTEYERRILYVSSEQWESIKKR